MAGAGKAHRTGCPDRWRCRRQLSRLAGADRVRAADAGRDVFVSPCLQEAGGVAVLEAMACARPVIVTAWVGHLSTVNSTTGVLVGVASREALVQELADAMIRLAGDPALRSRLGEAGRLRVKARYDWDVLVDRLLDIYDQVSASPRGESPLQPTEARP